MASTRVVGCDTRHLVNQDQNGWLLPVPPFDAAADPVNLAGLADEHLAGIELHHPPTWHWPMFSRPAELAGLLATFAGPDHTR